MVTKTRYQKEQEKQMLAKGINLSNAEARIKFFHDSMPQIVKDILAGKDISKP